MLQNHGYEGIYAAVQYKQCELFMERRYLNLVLLPQYLPNEFKTLINLVPAAWGTPWQHSSERSKERPKSPIFTCPSWWIKDFKFGNEELQDCVYLHDEDVCRFQVSVDDSQVVDEDEAFQKLANNVKGAKSPELLVAFFRLEVNKGRKIVEERG